MALSNAEAKFIGFSKRITYILWIRKLMNELDFPQEKACNLYCDNKAVIIISENHVQHEQTKYAG